ncbi:MAG: respiratory nitrate reductase subunit gamma [Anaerolineae bacterium]
MSAETLFWIIHLPLMLLFLVGLADVVGLWLHGRVEGSGQVSLGRKFLFLIGRTLRALFRRRFSLILRAFVTEAWFNRRLWQTSHWRWLSHFLLLNGFLLLMTLSGLAALSEKVLYHLFHLGHIPWVAMWYTADHPVTALLNEIGGLMMTVGLIFYAVRRYLIRPPQLRTGAMDTWMVTALGLILLTGWITEIVRLNAGYDGPAPYMAFIGYPLSRLVSGWDLPWATLTDGLYLGHGLLASVVIVTIPYSKFLHVVATALTATVNRVQEDEALAGGTAHVPA